jgi:hypothetical protein
MSASDEDEQKKLLKMDIISRALDDGWTVKKSSLGPKTFEFTKHQQMEDSYKGLVIFSKPNAATLSEDIQKHLDNVNRSSGPDTQKDAPKGKRSVSTPIIKN